MTDLNIKSGDYVGFKVEGLKEALAALKAAGADAQDMKDLMHRVGMMVVMAASPPVRTGHLKRTLRAGRGQTKAVVRAGGASLPYVGPIHYGWPARNIRPNQFLVNALENRKQQIYTAIDSGIEDILVKNNLK